MINAHAQLVSRRLASARQIAAQSVSDSQATVSKEAAHRSVENLASLQPTIAATGHGTPMKGESLTSGLSYLVANFDEVAVPDHGRYVPEE